MIIAQSVSILLTQPNTLRIEFNCIADEFTPLFMEIDKVYVFMKKGETIQLDLPDNLGIQQGELTPLSKFARAYTQQHKNWNLAWTPEELPEACQPLLKGRCPAPDSYPQ